MGRFLGGRGGGTARRYGGRSVLIEGAVRAQLSGIDARRLGFLRITAVHSTRRDLVPYRGAVGVLF